MIMICAILSLVNRSQRKSTKPLPYSRKIKIGAILVDIVDFCYFLLPTFPVYDKAYYQANKERYSAKKSCDVCGKLYVNKTNHNKTKFHTNAIKKTQ